MGGVAGLRGGAIDEALMRIVDFLYGVPYMFLVVLVMLLFADTARGQALPEAARDIARDCESMMQGRWNSSSSVSSPRRSFL